MQRASADHSETELIREASNTALLSSSMRQRCRRKALERHPPEKRMCARVEPEAKRSCAMPLRESCQQKRGILRTRHAARMVFRALVEETDQMQPPGGVPEADAAASWPRRAQCPQRTVASLEVPEQEHEREITAPFGAFLRFLRTRCASETPALSLKYT